MFNNIVEGFGGQDMKTEYLELNRCNNHCKTFIFDLQNLLQQRENTHLLLEISKYAVRSTWSTTFGYFKHGQAQIESTPTEMECVFH